MLPKEYRLRRNKDISFVLRKGGKRNGVWETIRGFARRDSEGVPRMCVVISSKVAKKAVVRNRIRRRLVEAMWRLRFELPRGVDMVCIVRDAAIADVPFERVVEEVRKMCC